MKTVKINRVLLAVLLFVTLAALIAVVILGVQFIHQKQLRIDAENAAARMQESQAQEIADLKQSNEAFEGELSKLREDHESACAALKEEYESAILSLNEEHEQALKDQREELVSLSSYKLYRNILSQDEVEQTLFGQPISEERDGEYRIGVKTAIDGDFHAELTVYQAKDGAYQEVFRCPAVIGKNGPGKQSEGDTKTPLGTWTVREAYGIKDDPGSLLPYTKVTEDMYWCATGSNGKRYNTLLYKSDDPDADYSEDEHLIDYDTVYDYLIDVGYNIAGAPYAGNAIFLHCWRGEDKPTGGCIAVSSENMVRILKTITPGTSITVY